MYDFPKIDKAKNKQQKALLTASKKGYRVMKNGSVYSRLGNKMSLRQDSSGYLRFGIRLKSGEKYTVFVHRLQAFQKYGYNLLDEGIQVRHLNGNKKDNSYSNIAIGTRSDNMMDVPKKIRIKKSSNANRKLTREQHQEIKNRYESESITLQELADEYGLKSQSSVHYIVNK